MESLPIEMIQKIAAVLCLKDTIRLGRINKNFLNCIITSVEFWKYKLIDNFGTDIINEMYRLGCYQTTLIRFYKEKEGEIITRCVGDNGDIIWVTMVSRPGLGRIPHRSDGPAVLRADGTLEWWLEGGRVGEKKVGDEIEWDHWMYTSRRYEQLKKFLRSSMEV